MSTTNATVTRPRWVRVTLTWLAGNAILGYLLAFPLVSGVLLARHVIGRGPSPLDDDGEVMASVLILVVVAGPLVLAAVPVNRSAQDDGVGSATPRTAHALAVSGIEPSGAAGRAARSASASASRWVSVRDAT